MRIPVVSSLAVLCLGVVVAPVGSAAHNPLKALIEQADPGVADSAREQLEAAVAADPTDTKAWLRLAEYSFSNDQPPATLAVLERGLATAAEAWQLWRFIADVHLWDARSGPQWLERPGLSRGRRPPSDLDDAAFRRQALEQALAALLRVRELCPENWEAQERQADVLGGLERWAEAEHTLSALLEQHWKYPLAAQRAYCLHKLERNAEALEYVDRQLAGAPHCPDLHLVRAVVAGALGRADEAAESRSRGEFYSRLLPESALEYTPELAASLGRLFGRREGTSGMFSEDRLNEQIAAEVDALIARGDEAGAELLAALAWSHYAHGPLEDRAYAYLGKQKDVARLDRIFRHAQSPCTLRGCLRQLVLLNEPGTFERLCELLPADGGFFPIGVVDLLADLGDPRSAKPIIEYTAGKDGAFFSEALVALGRFDAPETRRHLERWLGDSAARPFAAAGLYRVGGGRKHWKTIDAALRRGETFEVRPIAAYVRTLPTREARSLIARFDARVARERAQRERENEARRAAAKAAPEKQTP